MPAAPALERRTYTADEVESWEDAGAYELDDCGRLITRPMGARAEEAGATVIHLLTQHVRATKAGWVFASGLGLQIFPDRPWRMPRADASFIRRERLPALPDGPLTVPPDLVVAVVSPGNGADEMRAKAAEYLAAGAELVWVAFPSTRTVMVYRRSGVNVEFGPNDTITGENVLPGFEAKVSSFFPE